MTVPCQQKKSRMFFQFFITKIYSLEDFINDNPLSHFIYLWGNEGVGKNYLLRAVNQGHLEREKNTGTK